MSKILGGIFVGVFLSALCWEVFSRQNPELAAKVKGKLSGEFDDQSEPAEAKE